MRSVLKRKHAEAARLLELYATYKDSEHEWKRRKVHVDLDRFLMENRETAIMCIERVLSEELHADRPVAPKRLSLYQRLFGSLQRRGAKGGVTNDRSQVQSNASTRDA